MSHTLHWRVRPFHGSAKPPRRQAVVKPSTHIQSAHAAPGSKTLSPAPVVTVPDTPTSSNGRSGQFPNANSGTLRKCAVLATELHISVQQAVKMVSSNRKVLELAPAAVRDRYRQLRLLLGLNEYEASALLVMHPSLLLDQEGEGPPLREVARKARQLCSVLGVAPADMMNALCRLTTEERVAALEMSSEELEQHIADLQTILYPRKMEQAAIDAASSEVAAARRRNIIRNFLVHWPSLIITPKHEVARNMSALVRMFRQPARRVTILAARVPLLLTTPHPELRAKMADLRGLLQLSEDEAIKALIAYPLLLKKDTAEVRERVNALARTLGISKEAAAEIMRGEPNLLRYVPQQLTTKIAKLASQLRVSWNVVAALVRLHPAYLLASPRSLMAKVTDLGLVLNLPPARVVQMLLRFPRLLSYDVGKMRQNYQGLASFKLDPTTLTQMVINHPWLLRLPPAYINNRTAALATLFNIPQPEVVSMMQINPGFLSKPMASIQGTFDALVKDLGLPEGVASAAVKRAPVLLAYDLHTCQLKCRRLRQLTSTHPAWEYQLKTLLPDEVDRCMRYGEDTWERLNWLVEQGLQERISFLDYLVMDHRRFLSVFPAADKRAMALKAAEQMQAEELQGRSGREEGEGSEQGSQGEQEEAANLGTAGGTAPGVVDIQSTALDSPDALQMTSGSRWNDGEDDAADGADEAPLSVTAVGKQRKARKKWVGGRPDSSDFL